MSLIKCSECQKEISEEAISCPFCGRPNKIEKVHTIELTSKKWKIVKLISWVGFFMGLVLLGNKSKEIGSIVLVLSLIGIFVGKAGAWWSNR